MRIVRQSINPAALVTVLGLAAASMTLSGCPHKNRRSVVTNLAPYQLEPGEPPVVFLVGEPVERSYEELAFVEVQEPGEATKADLLAAIQGEGQRIGADAVVNVHFGYVVGDAEGQDPNYHAQLAAGLAVIWTSHAQSLPPDAKVNPLDFDASMERELEAAELRSPDEERTFRWANGERQSTSFWLEGERHGWTIWYLEDGAFRDAVCYREGVAIERVTDEAAYKSATCPR